LGATVAVLLWVLALQRMTDQLGRSVRFGLRRGFSNRQLSARRIPRGESRM